MDIVTDSVNRLEEMLKCSGCEETGYASMLIPMRITASSRGAPA